MQLDRLYDYLSSLYGKHVKIRRVREFSEERKKIDKENLKLGKYGTPYLIEFSLRGEAKSVVLETMRPEGFGHDHFSDRAQVLLWQHSVFNRLPRHVRSVDVGAFTRGGGLKSVGNCTEFFLVTEKVEGQHYHLDLDRIREGNRLSSLDEERCRTLAEYIAGVHSVKKDDPQLYARRMRDLIGHGEAIMGLADSYPPGLDYVSFQDLCEVEKKCVEWRWKLKTKIHRCARVHGDFHPWNILFREGVDFTVLDRSRGEWGEPADDVSALSINYIFYSLQAHDRLTDSFERLHRLFWGTYFEKTGDEEMLTVIQPFYVWRALVIASPVWYPNLSRTVRVKLFNFIKNMLVTERFDPADVNSYLVAREG